MASDTQIIEYEPPGPVAAAFMNADARVSALIGPYGSGKTSCAVYTLLKLAAESKPDSDGVVRVRYLVVRATYQRLISSTIPSIERLLPLRGAKKGRGDKKVTIGTIRYGAPIQITIDAFAGLEIVVDLLAMDVEADRERIEGSTYAAIVVDEARDTSWPVVQTALTRLRATSNTGERQPLRAMFVSNPSPKSHWLYKRFVAEPTEGWELFHQPSGLSPEAENLRFVGGRQYYTDMERDSDPSFARVHVHSEFGEVASHAAVVPEFSEKVHVADAVLEYAPVDPIVIGLDAGDTHFPAAVVGQHVELFTPDGTSLGRQLRILDELYLENAGAETAARTFKGKVDDWRRGLAVALCSIDPSAATNRTTLDESIKFVDIWTAKTGWPIKAAPDRLVKTRVEALAGIFSRMVRGGHPAILISPNCENLIRALSGGWKWKSVRGSSGEEFTADLTIDKTVRPDADLGDALGYLVLAVSEYSVLRNAERSGRRRGAPQRVRIAEGVGESDLF